jgi:PAS domain S-box-containing protein
MLSTTPSRLRFCLPADPSRLHRTRDRIRDYLQLHCADQDVIEDLVLGIDEACANVVRHSGSPDLEIVLGFRKSDLHIDVNDRGKGFDVSLFDPDSPPGVTEIGGRGLFIMARVSDGISLCRDDGIKVHLVKKAVLRQDLGTFESGLEASSPAGARDYRETRQRAFLDEIDEAFLALDWEYRYTHANQAAERLTNLPREAIMGHRPWELFPKILGAPVEACYREAMELGKPSTIEHRSVIADDWLEARVYPTSAGISVYLREINERKRVESEREHLVEELLLSEERFRATFEQAAVGIAHAALDGRLTRVNSLLCEMLGRGREELVGLTLQELVADLENVAQEPALIEALLQGHRHSFSLDRCFVRNDNDVVWASIKVSMVRDKRGEPSYFVAIVEDVTERRLAAAALKDGERRYRLVTENVSDVIWVLDVDTSRFTYVSPSVRQLRGYTPEEVMAHDFAQAMTPASLQHLHEELPARQAEHARGEQKSYVDEIEQTRKDGTTIWTETITRFIANDRTGHLEVYGVSRDVTERKALSDALARERDALAAVMANATAQVVYLDREFNFLMVNRAYAETRGYEPEEMVGLNHFALYPDKENEAIFRHVRNTGDPVEYVAKPFEFPGQPKRGVTYWDWRLSPVKDPNGDVRTLVFSLVDVTERVRQTQSAEALNRILEDISASLDPGEIVERLARRTRTLLRADSWSVLELDGEQWLETHSCRRSPGQSTTGRPVAESPLAAAALRERQVIAVQQPKTNVASPFAGARAKSTLVAPLLPANGQLCALCFTWHRRAHHFTDAEVDFVARVTAAAAPMLSNARLFHEQKYVARTLQEYFVHPLPEIAGLEVGFVAETSHEAALIGGDFSEVFEVGDGRVAVLVGDVSGRGVAAAGLGEIVRGAVRAFAVVDPLPSFILGRTNDLLLHRCQGYDFATAILLLLDPRSGAIVCSSAGHPPCLYVSPHDCRFIDLQTATPLGAFSTGYADHDLKIQTGDLIVLFTDGVTEARSAGDEFGSERLMNTVRALQAFDAQSIAEGVRDAAQRFAGHLTDDLQVLVLRLRP